MQAKEYKAFFYKLTKSPNLTMKSKIQNKEG